jgi:hypothetical protein
VDGFEPEPFPERAGGGRHDVGLLVDPDLDDSLRAGLLEQLRYLWSGHPEQLGHAALGLAQLVVEPARPNQRLEIAHFVRRRGRTIVMYRCAFTSA